VIMEFGLIKDDKVINRIVADLEFVMGYCMVHQLEYSDDPNAQVDWIRTDGKFERPQEPEIKPEPTAKDILDALITKGVLSVDDVATVKGK